MSTAFYLQNYNKYEPVLHYDASDGSYQLISLGEAKKLGLKRNVGAFVEEAGAVFGIYASPEGPVLFRNEHRVPARADTIEAKVDLDIKTDIHRYNVHNKGQFVFGTHYRDRPSISTNPYDNQPEDVDLFQMISSGLQKPEFYVNYTREWPGAS